MPDGMLNQSSCSGAARENIPYIVGVLCMDLNPFWHHCGSSSSTERAWLELARQLQA